MLQKLGSVLQSCRKISLLRTPVGHLVYIEDVCHISATVATYAVIVSVLHEADSSELILAVCDLTSLELFFHNAQRPADIRTENF
jgi:hypothetical protein